MNQVTHAWSPRWDERLTQRVRSLGYASLAEFLAAMPARPYTEVAAFLGPTVAPIQLVAAQFHEAKSKGSLREAAKDSLCRNIVEQFPDGWGAGVNSDWRIIKALSGWSAELIATGG